MSEKINQTPASAFSLFSKSYNAVASNWQLFALLYILPFLSLIGSGKNRNMEFQIPEFSFTTLVITFIGSIAVAILAFMIHSMVITLETEAAKDKTPSIKMLWKSAKKYWTRLLGLYIVVFLKILGGLILLIIPGLIMIRRYFLSPYVMVNEDLSISGAMQRSDELSKPYSGAVWGVIGVAFLISITSSLLFEIGPYVSFVLGIFYSVAPALRYLELKKLTTK